MEMRQKVWLILTIFCLLVGFCLLVSAAWIGSNSVRAQVQRPYSIFRMERSGQHRCVYVFGNQFGITSFSDYAVGEGRNQRCPELKQE